MPRHTYEGVTPETEAAISAHVKQVAAEMRVSTQYLYAVLASESTDPFAKFLHLFRAVCRKNPDGARGFIARLNTMLREETPQKSEAVGIGDALRTFGDLCAVSAAVDDGQIPPEKFEEAKQRHAETVERVTVYPPSADLRNLGN